MYGYDGIDRLLGLPNRDKVIRESCGESNIRITGISKRVFRYRKKHIRKGKSVELTLEEKLLDIINTIDSVNDISTKRKLLPIKRELERILYKIKMGIY